MTPHEEPEKNLKGLSPRDVARSLGVSESSVKRWVDGGSIQAVRTAGGHRRIPVSEAVRYVREHGLTVVDPELLGLQSLRTLQPGDDPGSRLEALLTEGRAVEARGLLLSLFLAGFSVAEIADGPLRAALSRIGELYTFSGPEGIYLEHRATEIALQGLREIVALVRNPDEAPMAIGCSVAGDAHVLPTLAAALVLRSIGVSALSLGSDLPFDALLLAVEHYQPRLIWLSVSHVHDREALSRELDRTVTTLSGAGRFLVVGGCAARQLELPASAHLSCVDRLGDLIPFATALVQPGEARRP